MELTAGEVWSRILKAAEAALPEQAFRTWLAPTQAVAISQDLLVVSTPNPFAVDWVEVRYAELLTTLGESLFGRRFTLSVQFQANGKTAALPPPPVEIAPPPVPAAAPLHAPSPPTTSSAPAPVAGGIRGTVPLNPRYVFDRFVVGGNNELAAAAAHAVAEAPARHYNPLFIYGGVGLGKTHLMHAIGHAMLEREPGKRVMYLSSERFTNEMVGAIQGGTMADFRRQYRQIDLLLVDDIQFLEGKEGTQEEFFHTFNALHDAQKQIVLTSDRQPKEIGLEDRLVSRFEWGLVADIKAPDFETRMAILRRKVEEDGLLIPTPRGGLTFIAAPPSRCASRLAVISCSLLVAQRRPIELPMAQERWRGDRAGDRVGQAIARRLRQKVRRRGHSTSAAVEEAHKDYRTPPGGDVPHRELFEMTLVAMAAFRGTRQLPGDPLDHKGRGHGCGPGVPPAGGTDPLSFADGRRPRPLDIPAWTRFRAFPAGSEDPREP